MAAINDGENPESKFSQTLVVAAKVPGVRIDRASYLRRAFMRYCTEEQIEQAIALSPAQAGISAGIIAQAATTSISYETSKVTGLSALSGIPGGFAWIGTVPADLAQYFAHILRIAQKLAYLHSWPDLFSDQLDKHDMDEATESMFTLFVGVMFGVRAANSAIAKVSTMMAAQTAKKLPQQALTKGVIYPAVKKVATLLGQHMTKQIFARGVAKVIPILGAGLSGGVTYVTYRPMAKRLQNHLATLEITKPGLR